MSPQTSLPDDVLLERLAQDDPHAFSALFHRYWEPLFVNVVKIVQNEAEAEDVVQEIFLSLWNRRKEVSIDGSPAAYLHTAARYKSINYIRKNITKHNYLAILSETAVHSTSLSPEMQMQFKELQNVLNTTIQNLPPKMKEAYQLSRKENLSHNEIAEKMGISSETVKKHIQRALQIIKEALSLHTAAAAAILFQIL